MADPSITRSARTYILAPLLATLAATTLIAMFLVILCPARVTFTVTHASRSISIDKKTVLLNLSIDAKSTTQRHTKVKFESIFIDLFNSSDPLEREDDWRRRISAHVDAMPRDYLQYQRYNTGIIINASAAAPKRTFDDFAPDLLIEIGGLTVTVMAQVHFKVGVVRTRLYGLTVNCDGVRLPSTTSAAAKFDPVICQ